MELQGFFNEKSSLSQVTLMTKTIFIGIATLVGNKLGGYFGDNIGVSKTIIGGMLLQAIVLTLFFGILPC